MPGDLDIETSTNATKSFWSLGLRSLQVLLDRHTTFTYSSQQNTDIQLRFLFGTLGLILVTPQRLDTPTIIPPL